MEQGEALQATDPRPPVWWEHRHELRGAGVAAAVAGVVAADGATVAIEGFDDAGPALVAGLAERGAVVVSVATAAGTLARAEGLAADQLAEAWAAHGPGFVAEMGGEVGSPAEVLSVSADALVAGSKVGIVDHDAAVDLRVRAVVPGGSLPVTAKALATLRRADIVVLPDFVTTAGPLFAWPVDGPTPTLDVARAAALADIPAALAAVADHPEGPLLGACELAERFLATWTDTVPFGRPIA